MSFTNKVHLTVKRSNNKWYEQSKITPKANYSLHLCGDSRRDGFWVDQAARACDLPDFMKDLDKVLSYCSENKIAIFSLYIEEK